MNLTEKIKFHCDNKKFCRVERDVKEYGGEDCSGFIVDSQILLFYYKRRSTFPFMATLFFQSQQL